MIDSNLSQAIRKGLLEVWDPIGVSDYGGAENEYDGYAPALNKLLTNGASEQQIFDFLWEVETQSMGLEGDRNHTQSFAKWLLELKQ